MNDFLLEATRTNHGMRSKWAAALLLAVAAITSACGGTEPASQSTVCASSTPTTAPQPPFALPACSAANAGEYVCTYVGPGWECTGECWQPFWDGPCAALDGGNDAGSFDPTTASCAELSAAFDQHVAQIGTACSTVSDCVALGGTGSCDCMPSLGASASGVAVSSAELASYAQATELGAIRTAFQSRCFMQSGQCSGNPGLCICDAAPAAVDCVNQHCVGTWQSCLSLP